MNDTVQEKPAVKQDSLDAFIAENKLTMPSQEKAVERMRWLMKQDMMLDFRTEITFFFLDTAHCAEFMKKEAAEEHQLGSKPWEYPRTLEAEVSEFLDYMKFAFGKAEDERGISASRSIQKLSEWCWLFGREDVCELLNQDELYNPYGAPALIAACDLMGIIVPDSLREFAKHKASR